MIERYLKNMRKCVGCFACAAICPLSCIAMEENDEGFFYPVVEKDRCINCQSCLNVCPVLNKCKVNHPLNVLSCLNTNEKERLSSSSGGLFSLFAKNILEEDGLVCGAKFDKDFRVVHSCVENKNDLHLLMGSKYVQSYIGNTYKVISNYLKDGRKVLFTGTPCQVSGLKKYLNYSMIFSENLFCIDFICHGVSSPLVWEKYLIYMSKLYNQKLMHINFRDKSNGWVNYNVKIRFENNVVYKVHHKSDLFMKTFLSNVSLRASCYQCVFKSNNRESDITMGDFWGAKTIFEECDDKGISVLFLNTEKGMQLYKNIESKTRSHLIDINMIIKHNRMFVDSPKLPGKRVKFFEKIHEIPFDKLIKKYCRKSLYVTIKNIVKISVLYRLIKYILK